MTGVVGASARAAVHSLARAGFAAWAVDLFADRDLKQFAPCAVCPIPDYPATLPRLAAGFPAGPVLYTGGLENYPDVVAQLATGRELWGNPPTVLEKARDPFLLFPALAAAGFAVPAISASPLTATRCLRKPRRSSGGHGIRFATAEDAPQAGFYFQELIAGPAMSAIYADASLFGVTEQLIGEPWLHARPFSYCGNIGPVEVSDTLRENLTRIGGVLVNEFGLRGVWGLDFILKVGEPFLLEVNPRYTAAVEVLEHGHGAAIWASGRREPTVLAPGTVGSHRPLAQNVGKAIYFAPHALTFPATGPWDTDLAPPFDPWRLPDFADIPEPGAIVEPGQPVLTFFATGESPAGCRAQLQSQAEELDRLFAEHAT